MPTLKRIMTTTLKRTKFGASPHDPGGDIAAPSGFIFIVDADGSYLTDQDGYYLVEPI